MEGTWKDGGGQGGKFTGKKTSGPADGRDLCSGAPNPTPSPSPGPTASPTPTPAPTTGQRQATGTVVTCNRGPNPADDFTCGATVGDTRGRNGTRPAGTVTFTSTAGGSFRYGPTCTLQPVTFSPAVAFCSVTWAQDLQRLIAAGTPVPVTGAYSGSTAHAPSTSTPPQSTVARLPRRPLVCFSAAPMACNGLNAIIPPAMPVTGNRVRLGFSNGSTQAAGSKVTAPKTVGSVTVEATLDAKGKRLGRVKKTLKYGQQGDLVIPVRGLKGKSVKAKLVLVIAQGGVKGTTTRTRPVTLTR